MKPQLVKDPDGGLYDVFVDGQPIGSVARSNEYPSKWDYFTLDGVRRGTQERRQDAVAALQSWVESPWRDKPIPVYHGDTDDLP